MDRHSIIPKTDVFKMLKQKFLLAENSQLKTLVNAHGLSSFSGINFPKYWDRDLVSTNF